MKSICVYYCPTIPVFVFFAADPICLVISGKFSFWPYKNFLCKKNMTYLCYVFLHAIVNTDIFGALQLDEVCKGSHTGKCIRQFGGIYAYCRFFIYRKW